MPQLKQCTLLLTTPLLLVDCRSAPSQSFSVGPKGDKWSGQPVCLDMTSEVFWGGPFNHSLPYHSVPSIGDRRGGNRIENRDQ